MFNEALSATFRLTQDHTMSSNDVIPLRKIYEEEKAKALDARRKKIALLKEQVQNGTYKPNLEVVAERMLSDLSLRGAGPK